MIVANPNEPMADRADAVVSVGVPVGERRAGVRIEIVEDLDSKGLEFVGAT